MVGMMKQYDPGYQRGVELVQRLRDLRYVEATTLEPEGTLYHAHHPIVRSGEPHQPQEQRYGVEMFSSIQQNIFTASDSAGRVACNSCHTTAGGRVPPAGMDLGSPNAHAQLVNVASNAKPGAVRVIPGDPENSYLIHKLEGRSGIVGLRMPRNGPPFLTEGQILVIRRWIELGAPNN